VQLYLIRHGQAGSRDNYDLLSELGRKQALLLGEYFRAEGISFHAAYAGSMRRQRETAELVFGEMRDPPEVRIDPRWNEFSLEGLWQTLAPRLIAENSGFARDYQALHSGNPNVDRVMTSCDVELIRAWMSSHPGCNGVEPWPEFRARVMAPRAELASFGSGESVAIFTSATPTALWCGSALELADRKIFHVAAVLFNTSFSTLRIRREELTLFSLNNTPHLRDVSLRTFR
jgi:broad specificity phosphatase PhoE